MENLQGFRSVSENLRDTARGLIDLSEAFYITGNTAVSEVLFTHARVIQQESKNLENLVSQEINGGLRRAQEATANMLNAALAAAQVRTQ